jgi:ethanolamine kinase
MPLRLQIEAAVAEANAYALASHIFWGVWALLQARYSAIDFDYVQYSKNRWNEYHKKKGAIQQLVAQAFN